MRGSVIYRLFAIDARLEHASNQVGRTAVIDQLMGNTTKSGYGSSTGNTEASNCNSSNSESSALALVESILKDDHSAVQRLIHAKRVQGDPLLQPPPIVLAALHGDLNMVKLLVFNGADVDEGILKPISRRGNSVSWELMEGKCALHFGAWRESCDIVGFLLEAGADPNVRLSL